MMMGVSANVLEQTADMEERPNVMVLEFLDDSITNYGSSSLVGDVIEQLGGVLVKEEY